MNSKSCTPTIASFPRHGQNCGPQQPKSPEAHTRC
uniref:Uncharacterized protein n=1 Tax=Nelumbo nucifera TaxID=4432 RepID=A0A822XXJ1_NELNU|nr:TPA_asm: hypothetical protein HUJ06_025292 [Nelumbo nucifera]